MTKFQSDRFFELWNYTVSHGQLLLRANKTNLLTTRVEILFKDVLVLNLTARLKGLTINVVSRSEVHDSLGSLDIEGRSIYRVATADFTGYVAAASFFVHEDDLDFDAPSALLRSPYL
jgi:hypothetical protein